MPAARDCLAAVVAVVLLATGSSTMDFSTPLHAQTNNEAPGVPSTLPMSWTRLESPVSPGLLRYNRIEGLSLGGRLRWGANESTGSITGRYGIGDHRPAMNVSFERRGRRGAAFVFGDHGLRSTQPFESGLTLDNSFASVFLGRDQGEYVRGSEVSLVWTAPDREWWLSVGALRERPANTSNPWSLSRWAGEPGLARPGTAADTVRTARFAAGLDKRWGEDPGRTRYRMEAVATVDLGSHSHVRSSLRAETIVPIGRPRSVLPRFSLRIRPEVGWVGGGAPRQYHRVLGGAWSVRGWNAASLHGSRWFSGRVQWDWHAGEFDVGAFVDAAWIGDGIESAGSAVDRRSARSVGVGLAALDNVVRVDLAVPLVEGESVRVEVWLGPAGRVGGR